MSNCSRPKDLSKANGAILYDVNNRGKKLALGMFNTGADEFLMRKGYTVLWSGWIAETQPGEDRLRLTAPVATENGRPITGPVRGEFVIEAATERHPLAMWANQGSYEPTESGEREAVLTWRSREKDSRVVIPRKQWRFEKRWVESNGERGQLPVMDLVVTGDCSRATSTKSSTKLKVRSCRDSAWRAFAICCRS